MSRGLFIGSLILAAISLYGFYFHAMCYPSWYVKIGSFIAAHGFAFGILFLKCKK
jgi:hypothetical protein